MVAKRILMRAGMTPFEAISAQQCLSANLIAKNSGNMLFAHSVYKSISARDVTIDVNRYRINEKYDAFVVPLANAFRRAYAGKLDALAEIIRKIRVPCIVTGVGTQTDLGHSIMGGSTMDASVKRFVSAILDKSASIGVRGEFIRDYLKKLGFSSVDVIGCPSMYENGPHMDVRKGGELPADARITINLTKGMPPSVCDLFRRTWKARENAIYVAQDMNDFKYIYLGKRIPGVGREDAFPKSMDHPLYGGNRMRFFFNVPSWISSVKGMDFSFGTRIHGNIFALLAGVLAVVVAHDSRTLELSRFFQIPPVLSSDINEEASAESLYRMADFGDMIKGHRARFEGYVAFLPGNGLRSIYDEEDGSARFEAKMQATEYPGPVIPITSCGERELRERLTYMHGFMTS